MDVFIRWTREKIILEASQCPYCLGTHTEMNESTVPRTFVCWACGAKWDERGKVLWLPERRDAS